MKDVANSAVRATSAKINNVAGAAVSNVAESALRATYTLNNVKDTANKILFFEDGGKLFKGRLVPRTFAVQNI